MHKSLCLSCSKHASFQVHAQQSCQPTAAEQPRAWSQGTSRLPSILQRHDWAPAFWRSGKARLVARLDCSFVCLTVNSMTAADVDSFSLRRRRLIKVAKQGYWPLDLDEAENLTPWTCWCVCMEERVINGPRGGCEAMFPFDGRSTRFAGRRRGCLPLAFRY